jgi:subtilisin family serine protease
MKRNLALVLAAFAVVACSDTSQPIDPSAAPNVSYSAAAENADIIPGRFIITLRDGVNPSAVAAEHGVRPDFVYSAVLNGFAGAVSEAARTGLMRDARVLVIEPDGIARAVAVTQSGATWGIDRVDQVNLPLSTTYTYTATGSGVTAYIIDTGINYTHSEFGGRSSFVYDSFGGTGADCNGHGTHVSGTVGGATYGIAKGVTLKAVRVLDCGGSGSWSGVIAGMDWVTQNHTTGPAVANMSLGGGASSSVDAAVNRMIADGVATAVAAGNGNWIGIPQDACKSSPARVAAAMTIGATNSTDARASWSNYGNCVDWFAPGVGIKSAWTGSNTATNTISGTSMATPHTTGVAALYLQTHASASAQTVRDALYALTTKDKVGNARSVNDHLLFSNF